MKVVLQDGIKDCGVCCLLSLVRYYGGDVSKEFLREVTRTNKSGVSAYDLIEGAKKLGFEAVGVKGDLSKIEKNNLPCLAHLIVNKSYKHFVVIYDINYEKNKILVMDPAKGKCVLTFGKFKLMSSNNYIFLKPIKALPVFNKVKIINKILKDFLKREKLFIGLIVILTLSYFVLQIITAFHFKYLLEFSINYGISNFILFLSIYLLILYLFKELSLLIRNLLLTKILSKLDLNLTFMTFKHVLLLPYLYFKNRTTGEVISRLRDLNVIKVFISQVCCILFSDLLGFIVFSVILFRINARLFLIIILMSILIFIFQLIICKIRKKKLKLLNNATDRVNSYLIEAISNIETVKGSHLEKRIFDNFRIKYQKFLEKNYTTTLLDELLISFKKINHDILLVLVFGIGSYMVIRNDLSLGQLFVYQNIFSYFMSCFNNLLEVGNGYQDFKISASRLQDLFTIRFENFKGGYNYSLYRLNGDIVFDKLNYSISSKCLFNDLSFKIEFGKKVLLVGESGIGKSTLVKMLMHYIDVPYGMLRINNIDINHYHLDNLRNNITYVSNNDSLFTDTIYNNIVLNGNVSEEVFSLITKICKVEEFVCKDQSGYQMIIEEGGFNFSSGEKQRIILARALMRKSDIYIFDEAFSQIDLVKTKEILKDILDYLNDKTVIVISHRNNFNKLFDKVFSLKDGKIYEVN